MRSIVHITTGYYSENNTRYVFVDGFACKTLDRCFSTLQEQLSLPAYFGKNLDALEEVLGDLDWIKEEKIKIIIFNATHLLENEPAKKNNFIDVLHSTGNEKLEIIYLEAPAGA